MDEAGDASLVVLARAADTRARAELVRRYLRPAFVVAFAIVHNTADAEDIAQDSMMIALHRIDQCRDPASFAPWLLGSVRNRAFKHLRRAKVRDAFRLRALQPMGTQDTGSRYAVRHHLVKALTRLTQVQREVVLLHDLEAWTHGEIAKTLGISETSSRQHLFGARKQLRETLKWDAKTKKEGDHG